MKTTTLKIIIKEVDLKKNDYVQEYIVTFPLYLMYCMQQQV